MSTIDLNEVRQKVELQLDEIRKISPNKISFHANFQRLVAKLAKDYGCVSRKEYTVSEAPPHGRNGALDVVWFRNGIPVLAIEIDSALRQKSILKLMMFKSAQRLWLYYGKKPFPDGTALFDPNEVTAFKVQGFGSGAQVAKDKQLAHQLKVLFVPEGDKMLVKIAGLPDEHVNLSQQQVRAIGVGLQKIAEECEFHSPHGRTKAFEIDYAVSGNVAPETPSVLDRLVEVFGNKRFGITELHRQLLPHRHPQFIAADAVRIEQQATEMVKQGIFVESRGPRGGAGWLLADTLHSLNFKR